MKASILLCLVVTLLTMQKAMAVSNNTELSKLENTIAADEARYEDIINGTEKHIRWFNNQTVKTPYSIVYLHGFSATRQELSPTTELLADVIGANVFYTRLKGHGRSDDALTESSVAAWKEDARAAFEMGTRLGDKVILISASTGGTLATWLQSTDLKNKLAANIMVSPNFGVRSSTAKILTWPGGLTVAKWLTGDYRHFTPINDKHALYWTERYPLEAIVPVLNLVDEVRELDKSRFDAPQFIVYSPEDQVVNVEKIKQTALEFKANKVTVTRFTESQDPAQHVLSGDACSPSSTQAMVDLMAQYIKHNFTLN